MSTKVKVNPQKLRKIYDLADFLTERDEKSPTTLDYTDIAALVFEYLEDKQMLKEE